MLIACIIVICVLILFVAITFFMTYKVYKFQLEGGVLKVQNKGSHLKIYFNDNIIKDVFSPQLLKGEIIEFKLGEKELKLSAKSNNFGNKLSIKIFEGEKQLATNGIEIKK